MKTIIVTGSNSGIGKEAALILANAGHRILMLSRDSEKSRQAHQEIVSQSGNENVFWIPVDLADPGSIRSAVMQITGCNIWIRPQLIFQRQRNLNSRFRLSGQLNSRRAQNRPGMAGMAPMSGYPLTPARPFLCFSP